MANERGIRFQGSVSKLSHPDLTAKLFRECQPKILVVTDNLNFTVGAPFGLTQFMASLTSGTIHGMTPQVIKASRSGALAGADLTNFHFDDATQGLLKSRYDVVFLFGFDGEGVGQLPPAEIDAIARFMNAGGGVFATGDHADLGAALSRDLPRVGNMRFWRVAQTPSAHGTDRLSTNVSGPNELEDFVDQSDFRPQSLYPNFRTKAGNPSSIGTPALAHPLLQLAPIGGVANPVVEVFPDHPHEGECHLPANLTTQFTLDGAAVDEWPVATGGGARVAPEIVAMSISHGSGFVPSGPKEALAPRSFATICAYDGQRAGVGRVVTDSTWHHFVNINLDGSGSGASALQTGSPPVDTDALSRIRQYYRNIATWLMPTNVRRCLRFPLLIAELVRYPLFEELVIPEPGPDPAPFINAGRLVSAALAAHVPAWEVEALGFDALAEGIGDKAVQALLEKGGTGRFGMQELIWGATGALTGAVVKTLVALKDPSQIVPHKTFEQPVREACKAIVTKLIENQRQELQRHERFLAALTE